jgi:DNA-binding Lrp family transcriptional regulator
MSVAPNSTADIALDPVDRRIVAATQAGLPLTARPYHAIARELGLPAEEVMRRITRMQDSGAIRRIGAVPNHYVLGWKANGMSVWDVDDAHAGEAGRLLGGLDYVSHCYRRPRRPPAWPYNLFAMVHGRSRDEVEEKIAHMADMLGDRDRGHDVLYSTKILKKTGLRIAG